MDADQPLSRVLFPRRFSLAPVASCRCHLPQPERCAILIAEDVPSTNPIWLVAQDRERIMLEAWEGITASKGRAA